MNEITIALEISGMTMELEHNHEQHVFLTARPVTDLLL